MLVLLLVLTLVSVVLVALLRTVARDGYRPAAFDPQYDSRGGDS